MPYDPSPQKTVIVSPFSKVPNRVHEKEAINFFEAQENLRMEEYSLLSE